jgi:hypothetical protein
MRKQLRSLIVLVGAAGVGFDSPGSEKAVTGENRIRRVAHAAAIV